MFYEYVALYNDDDGDGEDNNDNDDTFRKSLDTFSKNIDHLPHNTIFGVGVIRSTYPTTPKVWG